MRKLGGAAEQPHSRDYNTPAAANCFK